MSCTLKGHPDTRRARRALRGALLSALGLAASAGVASAHSGPAVAARLQGTFAMVGRVTVAQRVTGEHVGQHVTRTWTFTPVCSTGPCTTVRVVRARITGADTVVLHLRPGGFYAGRGIFYLPLGCAGRRYPHGEQVPFKLIVRVTGRTVFNATVVATSIAATYRNRTRRNLTPCVAVLGHDTATYSGTLTPAPA